MVTPTNIEDAAWRTCQLVVYEKGHVMWGSSAACRLHAVEEYGEGKQHGEIMHGGEHTLAGREEVPRR